MFSSRNAIILSFALLYIINLVSARQCYVCDSLSNSGCQDKPSDDFVHTCSDSRNLQNLNVGFLNGAYPVNYADVGDWSCGKLVGSNATLSETGRFCLPKIASPNFCKAAEKLAEINNIKIDHCSFCDSDLCNSSSNFSVSYYCIGIIISVLMYMR